MSKYIVCQTNYNCAETLKEALGDMGIAPESTQSIEASEETKQKETIKVTSGVGGQISFIKQDDGSFTINMSEYARATPLGQKVLSKQDGGNGELIKQYSKRKVLKTIGRLYGHKMKTCESKNGKIQIKITVH